MFCSVTYGCVLTWRPEIGVSPDCADYVPPQSGDGQRADTDAGRGDGHAFGLLCRLAECLFRITGREGCLRETSSLAVSSIWRITALTVIERPRSSLESRSVCFGHPTGLGKHLAGLGYRSNSASLYRGKGRSWRFEDWLVRETNPWQERSQINTWGDKGRNRRGTK